MPRIVFVNRFFYPDHSATSQMLSDLAFGLAARGQGIYVVTSRQRYDDPKTLLTAGETVNGVHIRRVWTSRFGRSTLSGRAVDYLTFYLSAGWRLARLVRRHDVIVAKTDPPLISLVAACVARLRGARLINWLQDLFPEVATALKVKGMRGSAAGVLRRLRNLSLKAAGVNVVLGDRMATVLKNQGIDPEKTKIIHNWADSAAVYPVAPEQNRLRREWGLADKFVVGYSGNMGRAHDFETILTAVERLKNEPGIVFLFIGDGHQRAWLQTETRRRGLAHVSFQPYQPRAALHESLCVPDLHLVSLLPQLEGLIVPSKFYGIAAAGRPVLFIGDTAGEIARIIENDSDGEADRPERLTNSDGPRLVSRSGAAVSIGDSKALADRVLRLYRSKSLCERWGGNARELLIRRFDKQVALAAWCDVLMVDDPGSI